MSLSTAAPISLAPSQGGQQPELDPRINDLDLKQTLSDNRLLGLWRMMAGYRATYFGATLSLGLAATAKTVTYLLLAYFVDTVLGERQMNMLPWVALGFVGLAVFEGAFTFLSGRLAAQTAEGITRRLRNYIFDHIQGLSFTYHDETQTGELIQRATSDVDAMRRFFADQAIGVGRIVLLFGINLTALLSLNVPLSLASIIVVPFIIVMSIFFFKRVSDAYERYQEQDAVLSTTLQENLSGVRVVRAFARQQYEMDKFERANQEKFVRGKKLLIMHASYWPISDILCGAQMLGGFTLGAVMAINGTITVGTYLAYAGMVIWLIWPMRNLGRLIVQMSQGLVSYNRVAEIIRQDREPMDVGIRSVTELAEAQAEMRRNGDSAAKDSVPTRPVTEAHSHTNGHQIGQSKNGQSTNRVQNLKTESTPKRDRLKGEVVFEDVRFAYEEDSPVLQGISFRAEPGQTIALLGPTGSGKTSLVNLLPRFYAYTGGTIRLDGVALTEYSRRFLRQQIGMVEQQAFLFSRTIWENITYGVGREVSKDEVEAAARAAAVHDVILSFPQGYETPVGERGVTLSGGQKQRIAIARTILKDPAILILDDSTSAVDTETEAEIRTALEGLMENRTTFVIAHRVQSLMRADQILVLDRGRIVQHGSHVELVTQPGIYRRIYAMQTQLEAEFDEEFAE